MDDDRRVRVMMMVMMHDHHMVVMVVMMHDHHAVVVVMMMGTQLHGNLGDLFSRPFRKLRVVRL